MGKIKRKEQLLLVILLLVFSIFVYQRPSPAKIDKSIALQKALENVPGYSASPNIPLDAATFAFLNLDDYIQTRYLRQDQSIDLYIGYYYTLDKVSAAHSPLVCFPGQGWQLSDQQKKLMQIGAHTIRYEEMIARLEHRQVLVLYWYQAQNKTESQLYMNKFNALTNLMRDLGQEHAFVRVTVPVGEMGTDFARSVGHDFILAFYPVFLSYINQSPPFSR